MVSAKRFVGQMCVDKLLVHFEDRDSEQNIPPIATIKDMEIVDKLNEQQNNIDKKKELLKLIANACSFNKEHSVKEILRNEIKGIDTVTYESANAWHDYVLLSEFFEECYGEHWDND